jgi:hypothetical protein
MYGAWRGNLSFSPARGRVAQGVYRMARAPRQDHEAIYATWLAGVRLRIRRLTRDEVIPVEGLPALTVERALADLIETGTDLSLVAGAVRDAVRAGKLVAPELLVSYLDPIAARRKSDGRTLAGDLFELADAYPEGWCHG